MTRTSKEELSTSMKRFGYITLALNFFHVSCAQDGTVLYVVVESFDNGLVLISDPKFGKHFKVNGHRLKPYLTAKPPTPADKVKLHLSKVHEDVITVTPSSHRLS